MKIKAIVAIWALSVLAQASAWAEPRPSNAQEADKLFIRARQLIKDGKPDEACPLFEASQKLDRALGTLLNLADCYEKSGKLAHAWTAFDEAAAWAKRNGDPKRESVARARADALKLKIAWVELSAAPGVALVLDGVPLEGKADGSWELPVEPGPHFLMASAPGKATWATKIDAPKGPSMQTVAIPPLDAPGPSPKPAVATSSPPAASAQAEMGAPSVSTKDPEKPAQAVPTVTKTTHRTSGTITAAAGGVLLAAGIAGILYSLNVDGAVARQQPGGSDSGHPTVTRARYESLGIISPAAIACTAVGAATLGFGTYLLLKPGAPQAGVAVGGRF